MIGEQPLTVVVRRRIKPGREAEFEYAMSGFVEFALSFPGSLGINVMRPDIAQSRDYIVVGQFADLPSRQAFKVAPAYQAWMRRLRSLSEDEPVMQEVGGVGGWFTLPERPGAQRPSRLRMALVTYLAVYPLTATVPRFVASALPAWHPLAANAMSTAIIVATLSWILMPLLTRFFRPWLFGVRRTAFEGYTKVRLP